MTEKFDAWEAALKRAAEGEKVDPVALAMDMWPEAHRFDQLAWRQSPLFDQLVWPLLHLPLDALADVVRGAIAFDRAVFIGRYAVETMFEENGKGLPPKRRFSGLAIANLKALDGKPMEQCGHSCISDWMAKNVQLHRGSIWFSPNRCSICTTSTASCELRAIERAYNVAADEQKIENYRSASLKWSNKPDWTLECVLGWIEHRDPARLMTVDDGTTSKRESEHLLVDALKRGELVGIINGEVKPDTFWFGWKRIPNDTWFAAKEVRRVWPPRGQEPESAAQPQRTGSMAPAPAPRIDASIWGSQEPKPAPPAPDDDLIGAVWRCEKMIRTARGPRFPGLLWDAEKKLWPVYRAQIDEGIARCGLEDDPEFRRRIDGLDKEWEVACEQREIRTAEEARAAANDAAYAAFLQKRDARQDDDDDIADRTKDLMEAYLEVGAREQHRLNIIRRTVEQVETAWREKHGDDGMTPNRQTADTGMPIGEWSKAPIVAQGWDIQKIYQHLIQKCRMKPAEAINELNLRGPMLLWCVRSGDRFLLSPPKDRMMRDCATFRLSRDKTVEIVMHPALSGKPMIFRASPEDVLAMWPEAMEAAAEDTAARQASSESEASRPVEADRSDGETEEAAAEEQGFDDVSLEIPVPRKKPLKERPVDRRTGQPVVKTLAWDVMTLHPEWSTIGMPTRWSERERGEKVTNYLKVLLGKEPSPIVLRNYSGLKTDKNDHLIPEVSGDSVTRALEGPEQKDVGQVGN